MRPGWYPPDPPYNACMTRLDLSLRVPDNLARQAKEKGILGSSSMAAMLRRELRRRELNKLVSPLRHLRINPIKGFSEEDLRKEILAVRQTRKHHARRP